MVKFTALALIFESCKIQPVSKSAQAKFTAGSSGVANQHTPRLNQPA